MNIYVLIGLCALLSVLAVASVVFSILYMKSELKSGLNELDKRNIYNINESNKNNKSELKQETDTLKTSIDNIKNSIDKKICDAMEKKSDFNIGEYCVQQEIEKAIENKVGYKLINNVMVYNYGSAYNSQIDHVLITPYGVFALETKYWKGTTYLLDLNTNDLFDDTATYNPMPEYSSESHRFLLLNIKDDKEHFYRPYENSNVMRQTVDHAKKLKKLIFGDNNNFVKGILVFVVNDFCKKEFNDFLDKEAYIGIMSLNKLVDLIKNDKLYTICKSNMSCENTDKVYKQVLEL